MSSRPNTATRTTRIGFDPQAMQRRLQALIQARIRGQAQRQAQAALPASTLLPLQLRSLLRRRNRARRD
ncbi:MAG: hypothetical protein E6Q88_10725 [Lysobacteraceae bacterium]|nr:MAG: hypothetical protein E6Q88_10725 [Xanthomonadaceae bacterium]